MRNMSKLICMQGLPASGKSTRACELLVEYGNAVRINRDLLRTMLHNNVWSGKKEDITFASARTLAAMLLAQNLVVVIDDTNLNPRVMDSWKSLAAECSASFQILAMDTSMDECVCRDLCRENSVGSDVIIGMALQYGRYPIPEAGFVICDLDGTIADIRHRLHFVRQEPKDWIGFFEAIPNDTPRPEVLAMLETHRKAKRDIILVSGRSDAYRRETEDWLSYFDIDYEGLFMRQKGDHRPDTIVKEEMLNRYFHDKSDIKEVIDDRPSVLCMWESYGLRVVDVGNGEEF